MRYITYGAPVWDLYSYILMTDVNYKADTILKYVGASVSVSVN